MKCDRYITKLCDLLNKYYTTDHIDTIHEFSYLYQVILKKSIRVLTFHSKSVIIRLSTDNIYYCCRLNKEILIILLYEYETGAYDYDIVLTINERNAAKLFYYQDVNAVNPKQTEDIMSKLNINIYNGIIEMY